MREDPILLSQNSPQPEHLLKGVPPIARVYKLVLTGGPCGGKTTGQAKLATFFENLGWKVFRVPETATVLMSGGIAFGELNEEQVMDFQENLIRTMVALEDTYFSMAQKSGQNSLVICDRGTMDASAFISADGWKLLLEKLKLNEIDICEGRYNHVVHMVSAANGAEAFYTTDEHTARFEGIELARERDTRAMDAWRMHPYVDVVDNRKDFESKLRHLLDVVVRRIGITDDTLDQFKPNARKVKFVIESLPDDSLFPEFVDFEVVHHYLQTGCKGIQSRLRKRGHNGRYTFTCTVRRPEKMGQVIEVKTPLSRKDYDNMLNHADPRHLPVYKTRRCFLYKHQQYQLDIYKEPCHSRCHSLILLETFTTLPSSELNSLLPPFLSIVKEATGDPAFSMFNLALKSEWTEQTGDFCHDLSDSEADKDKVVDRVIQAHIRLRESKKSTEEQDQNKKQELSQEDVVSPKRESELSHLPERPKRGEVRPPGESSDYYSSGNEM